MMEKSTKCLHSLLLDGLITQLPATASLNPSSCFTPAGSLSFTHMNINIYAFFMIPTASLNPTLHLSPLLDLHLCPPLS